MDPNSYSNTCWPELKSITVSNPFRGACLALALLAFGPGHAQSIEAARAAWVEGDFLAAAELATALDTAEGYALAAESLGTYGYFIATGDEQEKLYADAARYAEEALRRDPESVNAHIQSGHAVGRVAEVAGIMEALNNGYAQRVRDLLEAAAELDPESALAHSGIALWHARALDEGGLLARMMFGASREQALEHIELAIVHGAGSKLVLHDAAASLLILSERRHGDRARDLLLEARELPDRDARDSFVQQSILDILAELDG